MSRRQTPAQIDEVKKYDTVVSSGQSALRALLTLNGGATIAFLTFVGHLWDHPGLVRASSGLLVDALQWFIYGTFLAVVAYGTIFFTNCLSSVKWPKTSDAMFVVTVLCGVASAVCFIAAEPR